MMHRRSWSQFLGSCHDGARWLGLRRCPRRTLRKNKELLDAGHCLFVAANGMRLPSAKNNLPENNDLICSGAPAVPVV